MADTLPRTVQRLIKVFSKLPGVGQRTAMRFVLHLVQGEKEVMEELTAALQETVRDVSLCPDCYGLTDTGGLCRICDDPLRDSSMICVVENIGDLLAIESRSRDAPTRCGRRSQTLVEAPRSDRDKCS